MARRKSRRSSRGSMGGLVPNTNKIVKIVAFSTIGSLIAQKTGIIDPALAGAAGGYYAGGMVGGAAGYFVGKPLADAVGAKLLGGASQSSAYV